MASTLIKVAIGITAGTAAVGGGATVAYLTSGNSKEERRNENNTPIQKTTPAATVTAKPITELLREKGLTILVQGAKEWGDNWTKFKKDHETNAPKDDWSFTNWTTVQQKTDDTSDLKAKCTTNSKKQVTDETAPLYQSVVKYCTKQSS